MGGIAFGLTAALKPAVNLRMAACSSRASTTTGY